MTSQEAVALVGEQATEAQITQPNAVASYGQVRVPDLDKMQGDVISEASSESVPALGTPAFRELCEQHDHRSLPYRAFKRGFDFAFALIVVAIGLIPGALLSIAIALDTKGTPI